MSRVYCQLVKEAGHQGLDTIVYDPVLHCQPNWINGPAIINRCPALQFPAEQVCEHREEKVHGLVVESPYICRSHHLKASDHWQRTNSRVHRSHNRRILTAKITVQESKI